MQMTTLDVLAAAILPDFAYETELEAHWSDFVRPFAETLCRTTGFELCTYMGSYGAAERFAHANPYEEKGGWILARRVLRSEREGVELTLRLRDERLLLRIVEWRDGTWLVQMGPAKATLLATSTLGRMLDTFIRIERKQMKPPLKYQWI